MGYTALLAVIAGMFYFGEQTDVVMAVITVLTNVLTGAVTFYYTKHQLERKED